MNQRHIHDDSSFQDINIKNNNKKAFGSRKQYFSNHDSLDNNTTRCVNNNNGNDDDNDDDDTIRCVNNISIENNDLVGNLEEFGLSQYEARAYLTMIGKGSLSASEIAYYSHLPRTKIYLTLKKGLICNFSTKTSNM